MSQTWQNLLFAHWPIEPRVLTPLVPAAFPLDLYDGAAWIGVVPFEMRNVAPRGVPSLPWVSAFPELNVRTYVTVGGKPGVYFFSLDAGNPLAVYAARLWLRLPYFSATMRVDRSAGPIVTYRSRRKTGAPAEFIASYGPVAAASRPHPGALDFFLTERYCLYAINHRNHPYRLDIHHAPWLLQAAQADLGRNTMASAAGIHLPSSPPLLHFVERQDMVAWAPARID